MGMITIYSDGSFPRRRQVFGAMNHGHAHAVAEAIRFLSEEVLPDAIERDHRLHTRGEFPRSGFDRPKYARIENHDDDGGDNGTLSERSEP